MHVPIFHGLAPRDLLGPARPGAVCFPFNAARRWSFYRARNAIYYLFRSLVENRRGLTVLMPDYNSGNEVLAIRGAGATIQYCPIGPQMQLDPIEVERLCQIHNPDVLYVIHYAGWPQPMPALVDVCRRRNMILVEDCALALLSELDGRPLGSFGDWSVFCLYKTLPVPNGALLVHNGADTPTTLQHLRLRTASPPSVIGRTAELIVQRARGRVDTVGFALQAVKRAMGRAVSALDIRRATVGDIGFELEDVDLAMSDITAFILKRLDCGAIRQRRIENFRLLSEQLTGVVARPLPEPAAGVCPLFFPILVPDKTVVVAELRKNGVEALEFWNDSVEPGGSEMSAQARFLRSHVVELPIHQDLTARHMAHVAAHLSRMNLRMTDARHRILAA
jgi:dTDP-4-amino-4,6-dideoxygalactose transaminase